MKNKKLKKAIIIIGICVVLAVGITIGVIALNKNSRRAYVQSVSELNMGGIGPSSTYNGTVVESAQQKIFAGSDKKIDEVFVEKGSKVKKGDKIFRYDTRLLELSVQEKELTVSICETSLESEKKKLEFYKSIVPVEPTEAPTEPEAAPEGENPESNAADAHTEDAPADQLAEEETQAKPEKTYTAQEKADLIANQEIAIKRSQNQLDTAKEGLEEAKNALADAVATAKLDGTVKDIQDPEKPDVTAPFCTIIGSTGVTIKGYVSEFDLSDLHVGDTLNVSSFMTEASTTAEVLTVSDYPADSPGVGNDGNQNTSYYEFTAFMDQSDGFDIGEDVRISKIEGDENTASDVITLSKAYVRTDSTGSYVLKDVDGKLARQDVKIKKGTDGDYVIITDGLTLEDKIAFPYGSKGKEGLLTTTEQQGPSIF